jgi:hypothetical protein
MMPLSIHLLSHWSIPLRPTNLFGAPLFSHISRFLKLPTPDPYSFGAAKKDPVEILSGSLYPLILRKIGRSAPVDESVATQDLSLANNIVK